MNDLIEEILEDLTLELQGEPTFNQTVLEIKVKGAYKAVQRTRRYPSNYTEDMIAKDMGNYYINIRDIALYDYNHVGAEFEDSHNESSVSRTWKERDELFYGVLPLARF